FEPFVSLQYRPFVPAFEHQQPHGVEQDEERPDLVVDGSPDWWQVTPRGQQDGSRIDQKCEDDNVLLDNPQRLPGDTDGKGQRVERIAHQDDVAGLCSDIRAYTSQCQSDVTNRQCGS